jgi:hypothetical protein
MYKFTVFENSFRIKVSLDQPNPDFGMKNIVQSDLTVRWDGELDKVNLDLEETSNDIYEAASLKPVGKKQKNLQKYKFSFTLKRPVKSVSIKIKVRAVDKEGVVTLESEEGVFDIKLKNPFVTLPDYNKGDRQLVKEREEHFQEFEKVLKNPSQYNKDNPTIIVIVGAPKVGKTTFFFRWQKWVTDKKNLSEFRSSPTHLPVIFVVQLNDLLGKTDQKTDSAALLSHNIDNYILAAIDEKLEMLTKTDKRRKAELKQKEEEKKSALTKEEEEKIKVDELKLSKYSEYYYRLFPSFAHQHFIWNTLPLKLAKLGKNYFKDMNTGDLMISLIVIIDHVDSDKNDFTIEHFGCILSFLNGMLQDSDEPPGCYTITGEKNNPIKVTARLIVSTRYSFEHLFAGETSEKVCAVIDCQKPSLNMYKYPFPTVNTKGDYQILPLNDSQVEEILKERLPKDWFKWWSPNLRQYLVRLTGGRPALIEDGLALWWDKILTDSVEDRPSKSDSDELKKRTLRKLFQENWNNNWNDKEPELPKLWKEYKQIIQQYDKSPDNSVQHLQSFVKKLSWEIDHSITSPQGILQQPTYGIPIERLQIGLSPIDKDVFNCLVDIGLINKVHNNYQLVIPLLSLPISFDKER